MATSAWVEIVKSLAWPVVVLIALLALFKPLHSLLEGAGAALSRAESVTIAGVSVSLSKDFIASTPKEVIEVLGEMNPSEIDALMKFAGTEGTFPRNPGVHDGMYSQQDFELLTIRHLVETYEEPTNSSQGVDEKGEQIYTRPRWRMTALGASTHKALRRLTTLVVREIVRSSK